MVETVRDGGLCPSARPSATPSGAQFLPYVDRNAHVTCSGALRYRPTFCRPIWKRRTYAISAHRRCMLALALSTVVLVLPSRAAAAGRTGSTARRATRRQGERRRERDVRPDGPERTTPVVQTTPQSRTRTSSRTAHGVLVRLVPAGTLTGQLNFDWWWTASAPTSRVGERCSPIPISRRHRASSPRGSSAAGSSSSRPPRVPARCEARSLSMARCRASCSSRSRRPRSSPATGSASSTTRA